ncbi:hypothetical protein RB614_25570 [Phytohabitans sp. ZYX-F-186]|uniref:Integral membrane protein n=1 Tax=Phytohabitans maris TaxID=3071409 RepID=A0ABU0ZLP1_9ACTN|nr:hypothetical protein [Phytohabitans sp. ZYX-F-186]MDQ7907898.1 hypothetical protein [Phytohabitans sp. ZYX-F-186]
MTPPPVPPRSDATIVMRILATPLTWLGALLLLCLSVVPAVALGDANATLANWLPLGVFVLLLLAALAILRRWVDPRDWVPTDVVVWLVVLYALIPLGEELDLDGGAAVALTLAGLALAAATTARLVVFHMRRYRRKR